jgi:hypothetical protein
MTATDEWSRRNFVLRDFRDFGRLARRPSQSRRSERSQSTGGPQDGSRLSTQLHRFAIFVSHRLRARRVGPPNIPRPKDRRMTPIEAIIAYIFPTKA